MKFTSAGLLLSAATLAQASRCKPSKCHHDSCLRDIIASNFPQRPGTADCSSYLLTTVTPEAVTHYVTLSSTISATTTVPVTVTQTVDQTATTIVSVVQTAIVSYTETQTVDEIVSVTATDTVTITRGPLKKRHVTECPTNIPIYASACSGPVRYSSACSCIGVTARTTTAPTPTSYVTETNYFTLPAATVQKAIGTETISPTVATVAITTTFSTQVISQGVATNKVTRTTGTQTVKVTQTATVIVAPPAVTGKINIAYPAGNNNPNVYAYNKALNAQAYFIDGTSAATDAVTFRLNADGTVDAVNGPAAGSFAFYSTNVGQTSFILVTNPTFAASQGGTKIACSLDSQNRLRCTFKNSVGDWWMCGGHLNLVQSGYDFTNTCNAGGTSTKVDITLV